MIPPRSNIYLETSAVNALANRFDWGDGKATKIYHSLKGTRFYISPVVLWEIFLTNNEKRREILIHYLQHLAYDKLLNSPSEFIINYLLAGCPLVEKHYDFHSKLSIAKTWTSICRDTKKTFIFNKEELARQSELLRKVFKYASKQIEEVGIITPENIHKKENLIWLENIVNELKGISLKKTNERTRKIYKISILLILLILCSEIDIDSTFIKKYWSKIGLHEPEKRLEYLLKNHELLVYRGPFVILSEMVLLQLEKGGKPTRGIFWDALHSIYLIYTDYFFSADDHFKKLRDNDFPIFKRINHFNVDDWFIAKKLDIEDEKIIS